MSIAWKLVAGECNGGVPGGERAGSSVPSSGAAAWWLEARAAAACEIWDRAGWLVPGASCTGGWADGTKEKLGCACGNGADGGGQSPDGGREVTPPFTARPLADAVMALSLPSVIAEVSATAESAATAELPAPRPTP